MKLEDMTPEDWADYNLFAQEAMNSARSTSSYETTTSDGRVWDAESDMWVEVRRVVEE